MAFKIRYTNEVLADLHEVTDYADSHFPGGAVHFFPGLLDKIDFLGTYPRIGNLHTARSKAR